jgi:hypothetical protein
VRLLLVRPFATAPIATLAMFCGLLVAAAQEVITQDNGGEVVEWFPVVSNLYAVPDQGMPNFQNDVAPDFSVPAPETEGTDDRLTEEQKEEQAEQAKVDNRIPQLTLVSNQGPPTLEYDWATYTRQQFNGNGISILASSLVNGKPRLWAHDCARLGYMTQQQLGARLNVFFSLALARERFPISGFLDDKGQVDHEQRRQFIFENVRIVLGQLRIEQLNGVSANDCFGGEVDAAGPVYEEEFGGATLAEVVAKKGLEFTPRLPTLARGEQLDGVYRLSLELEAWGQLGLDVPSRRRLYAEVRFTVQDLGFEVDVLGGQTEGGQQEGAEGGAEAQ